MSKSRTEAIEDCLKELVEEMKNAEWESPLFEKAKLLLSSTGSEPEPVDSENPLWKKGYLKGVDDAQSKAKLSSQPSPPSPGREEPYGYVIEEKICPDPPDPNRPYDWKYDGLHGRKRFYLSLTSATEAIESYRKADKEWIENHNKNNSNQWTTHAEFRMLPLYLSHPSPVKEGPTEGEIEKAARFHYPPMQYAKMKAFIEGAKWLQSYNSKPIKP
jgi:hypothetical protein